MEKTETINEHLSLTSRTTGLSFGTDAYLLAAFVRPRSRAKAADLGSGTGVIPLLLLEKNKCKCAYGLEIQPLYADLIEKNARENGLSDRLSGVCADVRTATDRLTGGPCDLVVSNPPYLKVRAGKSCASTEKEMARHETQGDISDFCACAARLLRSGGDAYFVWRPDRLTDLISALRACRLEPKRILFVHGDCLAEPSLCLVESRKDAKSGCRVLPPLFLHEPGTSGKARRPMTERAALVYETCQI